MLYILEPTVAALTAHADTVRILADIGSNGDGTSNGIIFKFAQKAIAALAVLGVPAFGVHAWRVHADKDTAGKQKKMTDEAKNFVLYEGFLAVAWTGAQIAGNLFAGGIS
jgi:hypothetical protein